MSFRSVSIDPVSIDPVSIGAMPIGSISIVAMSTLIVAALCGCKPAAKSPSRVGVDLPVASSRSVALPGATDAADAPGSPAVAEPRQSDLVTYQDTTHGVRFQYPSVWRPLPPNSSYLASPEFAQVGPKPAITEAFNPARTDYADTVLSGLGFSYAAKEHSSAASCAALPGKAVQDPKPSRTVHYNGRAFSEDGGSDAGMCHDLVATVDSTLAGTTCYVFERDTMTLCPFVKSPTTPRPLTAAEQHGLQRHLDAVMESVMITPPR